jgi:hypothetical protein
LQVRARAAYTNSVLCANSQKVLSDNNAVLIYVGRLNKALLSLNTKMKTEDVNQAGFRQLDIKRNTTPCTPAIA